MHLVNAWCAWARAYETGRAAWDTGMPSPELLLRLADLKLRPCRVLDIGCGSGANAIFMARQGHSVVGVDFVGSVVQRARDTAAKAGLVIDFRVADFTQMNDFKDEFDFAFDSGCYHSIRAFALSRYMRTLFRAVKPGAYCLSLIGNSEDGESTGPARVSALSLVAEHQPYFDLVELRRFRFDSTISADHPLGWSALMTRKQDACTLSTAHNAADVETPAGKPLLERINCVLKRLALSPIYPWRVSWSTSEGERGAIDLLIECPASDSISGQPRMVRYQRSGAFTVDVSDDEILEIFVTNLAVFAVHELLEHVTVDGERRYDPHSVARMLDTRYAELITLGRSGALMDGENRGRERRV